MSYIEHSEAELVKKLQSAEDPAVIMRWVTAWMIMNQHNGSSTGGDC